MRNVSECIVHPSLLHLDWLIGLGWADCSPGLIVPTVISVCVDKAASGSTHLHLFE